MDELDLLWKETLDRWDDEKVHALFLERCRALEQLGFAAKCYREQTGEGGLAYRVDAMRAEGAKKRLASVLALAMLELAPKADAANQDQYKRIVRGAGALMLAIIILSAWLATR
jgi:hypothetical protein